MPVSLAPIYQLEALLAGTRVLYQPTHADCTLETIYALVMEAFGETPIGQRGAGVAQRDWDREAFTTLLAVCDVDCDYRAHLPRGRMGPVYVEALPRAAGADAAPANFRVIMAYHAHHLRTALIARCRGRPVRASWPVPVVLAVQHFPGVGRVYYAGAPDDMAGVAATFMESPRVAVHEVLQGGARTGAPVFFEQDLPVCACAALDDTSSTTSEIAHIAPGGTCDACGAPSTFDLAIGPASAIAQRALDRISSIWKEAALGDDDGDELLRRISVIANAHAARVAPPGVMVFYSSPGEKRGIHVCIPLLGQLGWAAVEWATVINDIKTGWPLLENKMAAKSTSLRACGFPKRAGGPRKRRIDGFTGATVAPTVARPRVAQYTGRRAEIVDTFMGIRVATYSRDDTLEERYREVLPDCATTPGCLWLNGLTEQWLLGKIRTRLLRALRRTQEDAAKKARRAPKGGQKKRGRKEAATARTSPATPLPFDAYQELYITGAVISEDNTSFRGVARWNPKTAGVRGPCPRGYVHASQGIRLKVVYPDVALDGESPTGRWIAILHCFDREDALCKSAVGGFVLRGGHKRTYSADHLLGTPGYEFEADDSGDDDDDDDEPARSAPISPVVPTQEQMMAYAERCYPHVPHDQAPAVASCAADDDDDEDDDPLGAYADDPGAVPRQRRRRRFVLPDQSKDAKRKRRAKKLARRRGKKKGSRSGTSVGLW